MVFLGILIILSFLAESINKIVSHHNYTAIMSIVLCLGVGVALIVGAILENKNILLFALVLYAMLILMVIVNLIFTLVDITILYPEYKDDCSQIPKYIEEKGTNCEALKHGALIVRILVGVGALLFNGYFWICALSFYLEVNKLPFEASY